MGDPLAMSDHDAELDAIVALLASAGLLIETTEDGKPALQLTPKGAQVASQMAIGHEDDAFAMFTALLDAAEGGMSARQPRRREMRRGPPLAGRAPSPN
jgi:hypothetical protein